MGLRPTADALCIDPCVPSEWPTLDLRVRYCGALVRVRATAGGVTVGCDRPIRICLGAGPPVTVGPGERASP